MSVTTVCWDVSKMKYFGEKKKNLGALNFFILNLKFKM